MNMQFLKSTKFPVYVFAATAIALSACSGGGGETSLNGNSTTSDVTTTSVPPVTVTPSTESTTATSPTTSAAAAPTITGYLTVPSGLRAGQTAVISGHGYKPQSSYFLSVQDPAGGISTQNISVEEDGNFQFQLGLPQSGIYQATAVDNDTGTEVGKVIVSAAPMD